MKQLRINNRLKVAEVACISFLFGEKLQLGNYNYHDILIRFMPRKAVSVLPLSQRTVQLSRRSTNMPTYKLEK